MRLTLLASALLSLPAAAQIRGGLNPTANDNPRAVRNLPPQPADEIVTLRYFRIRKGSFDQFLKASIEGVWPYFEKIGSRVIGMWKVIEPDNVEGVTKANRDYDEVYLMTRYATVEHWKATRDPTLLGGNGPDWDLCKKALDLRQSLTISSTVQFLKGSIAPSVPYFMPGTREVFEKK
jgi:hypothetical protein